MIDRPVKPEYFPVFAADMLADEAYACLDVQESGILFRLMLNQWCNGSLPSDDKKLARMAGCSIQAMRKFHEAFPKLLPLDQIEAGGDPARLAIPFLRRKYVEIQGKYLAARENGRNGGQARARGNRQPGSSQTDESAQATGQADGQATAQANGEPVGQAIAQPPKPKPKPKREEGEAVGQANLPLPSAAQKQKRGKPQANAEAMPLPQPFETPAVRQALSEWIDHKRAIGNPATEGSLAKLVAKYQPGGSRGGEDAAARLVADIDHSIASGWKGVYPDRDADAGGNGGGFFGRDPPPIVAPYDFIPPKPKPTPPNGAPA